jgi:hypothetical protein
MIAELALSNIKTNTLFSESMRQGARRREECLQSHRPAQMLSRVQESEESATNKITKKKSTIAINNIRQSRQPKKR